MNLVLFDISVRGAATGISLMFLAVLWINDAPRETRIAFTLTVLANLCRTWSSLPPGIHMPEDVLLSLRYVGATAVIFFTWAFVTLFVDDRRYFWAWIGSATLVTLGLWFAVFDPWVSDVIRAYALVHIISFMTTIVFSQKDDLVDKRRRARVWAAVCVIGHVVTVALFGSPMLQETTVLVPLTQSLSQLFASAVFTLWAVTRNEQTWVLGQSQSPVAQAASDMTKPVQIALVRQIEVAMQNEVWRQEGLTVSGLAQVVGMPEHQVRNAINQVLGYRNFSSFINKARIESAKTTLANAEHMGTSVQKIAYSVGFSSIGPFNRAFRDDTGQSPSDYRKAALAAELVDS